MKNLVMLLIITGCFAAFSCGEKESERFILLTDPIWITDSLLVDGIDATGPGELLEDFIGETKFNKDGTGYFGDYTGTWMFMNNETQLVISSDSIPVIHNITTDIKELTSLSLKVTTKLPNPADLTKTYNIRMTFKVK